jgi:hypothetical protein
MDQNGDDHHRLRDHERTISAERVAVRKVFDRPARPAAPDQINTTAFERSRWRGGRYA